MRNPFKKSNKISKKDLSMETIEEGEIKILIRWKDEMMTVLVKPDNVEREMAMELLEQTALILEQHLKPSKKESSSVNSKKSSYIS